LSLPSHTFVSVFNLPLINDEPSIAYVATI
jgi:hypothetical protein